MTIVDVLLTILATVVAFAVVAHADRVADEAYYGKRAQRHREAHGRL